jgi:hypothetical protein
VAKEFAHSFGVKQSTKLSMAFQRASTVRSFLARRRPSTWRRPVRLGSNRHCQGEEHQAGAGCFDLLLNISNECIAVDWAVEPAGRGQAVASKRADKGRGLPAAVWNHINHALVAGPPSCSRVMFLLDQVSSIKTSWLGIRLACSSRHSARALATSARSCSAARSDFF